MKKLNGEAGRECEKGDPMIDGYSLRPASSDDLDAVLKIEAVAQPSGAWTRSHFESELEKPYSRFLVFTDDETDSQRLGYIVYWVLFEEVSLQTIAVHLESRGMGFAKAMLRAMVTDALKSGARKVNLEVRKSNESAIHLYQGLGFTVAQVRKGFYSNGEDDFQMTLHLEGAPVVF
jgi:ribosomal-protein-alanine N-acetyltransferase